MNVTEVYLKFKAWLVGKISAAWNNLTTAISREMKAVGKAMPSLGHLLGEFPGKIGAIT